MRQKKLQKTYRHFCQESTEVALAMRPVGTGGSAALCPVSVESVLSLILSAETVQPEIVYSVEPKPSQAASQRLMPL